MRWLLAILLFVGASALAQTLPEPDRPTITDHADLLSDLEEDRLHQRLVSVRDSTGVQMAVVTLPSQAAYAPDITLEQFATDLFNGWGIGDADRNDGILVLILTDDRAIRIELGAAYGHQWDRAAATVINRSFLPAFEVGRYADGVFAGVTDITDSIAVPFTTGEDAPVPDGSALNWMAIFAFAGAALFMLRRRLGRIATRFRRCPNCGHRALTKKDQILRKATAKEDGEGEQVIMCSQCTYSNSTRYRIAARNTRYSTSGRGGFGGGQSGGGGATGRW